MNPIKKFMASSERVYAAILVFSVMTLVVNLASLLSQEKTRLYIHYLEERVAVVENRLRLQSIEMQELYRK